MDGYSARNRLYGQFQLKDDTQKQISGQFQFTDKIRNRLCGQCQLLLKSLRSQLFCQFYIIRSKHTRKKMFRQYQFVGSPPISTARTFPLIFSLTNQVSSGQFQLRESLRYHI